VTSGYDASYRLNRRETKCNLSLVIDIIVKMKTSTLLSAFAALCGSALFAAACSSESKPPEPEPYVPPVTERDSGVVADTAPPIPSGIAASKAVCADYITCSVAATPAAASGVITDYGSTSNCWKGTEAEAKLCEKACADGKVRLAGLTRRVECGYKACTPAGDTFLVTNECDVCLRTQTEDRCCAERAKCAANTACVTFAEATWARCANDKFGAGPLAQLRPHARELSTCLDEYQGTSPAAYADFKALQACVGNCGNSCTRRRN
jgi:hypothetical protein